VFICGALKEIADLHIDLAMKLAEVLKQTWVEVDKWNDNQKRSVAALANPDDGSSLDCLDRLSVFFSCINYIISHVGLLWKWS